MNDWTRAIPAALEQGVAYLARSQRPSGEFATYTAPHLDMTGAKARSKSVYMTTFVIEALSHLPRTPLIEAVQGRAVAFLQREQDDNGAWHYDGRGGQRTIPQDMDDTCCAVAALLRLGRRPDLSFYPLLWQNEAAPGGPYYTWIGVNDRSDDHPMIQQTDLLVNANVLFCGGFLQLDLPGVVAYLNQAIDKAAYQSLFCISPHFPIYALSRAYGEGQGTSLAPAISMMQDYILTGLAPPEAEPSVFNIACLGSGLLNLKASRPVVEPYLMNLLPCQQDDGRWPAWAAYLGYGRLYDGAPALTTALALEALGKYLTRPEGRGRK